MWFGLVFLLFFFSPTVIQAYRYGYTARYVKSFNFYGRYLDIILCHVFELVYLTVVNNFIFYLFAPDF